MSEVIVCGDGSAEMTVEVAKVLGVEVIRYEGDTGYGGGFMEICYFNIIHPSISMNSGEDLIGK